MALLRDKILDLFRDEDPEVQVVIGRVLEEEWARLSYERPRILEEIRQIIDAEVNKDEA